MECRRKTWLVLFALITIGWPPCRPSRSRSPTSVVIMGDDIGMWNIGATTAA